MSPVEKDIMRRKLGVIVENLSVLKQVGTLQTDEYVRDVFKRKAAERLLQEIVEAAVDINTHIVVQTGHQSPSDYYQSFIAIGELGVITMDLAEKLAPSAGLRNRLVHEYDIIDHLIVFRAIKTAVDVYPEYVRAIENYLAQGN